MVTLTEFLLARVAEDERAAHASGNGPAWLQQAVAGGLSFPANDAARNVDKCKALRRVVERCSWADGNTTAADDWEITTFQADAEAILRELAAVYADHRDYRQEWRR